MKGVAEGNAYNYCVCNEKFVEWLEIYLLAWLRQLHRAFEEGRAAMIHQRQEQIPASVDYAIFRGF